MLHPLIPAAAKLVVSSCKGRLTPSWAPQAEQIFSTLRKLDPCMSRYAKFIQKANSTDTLAQAQLVEFYVCCAVRLRPQDVVACNKDKAKLLILATSVANDRVLPFFQACREFVAGYDKALHQKLDDLERFRDAGTGQFWHHCFDAAAPEAYSAYRNAVLPPEAQWPAAEDCDAIQDVLYASRRELNEGGVARGLAEELYATYLEASAAPLQARLQSLLLENGILDKDALLYSGHKRDVLKGGYRGGLGYWNERYEKRPEPFEWLECYTDIRFVIESVTEGKRATRFLHVGCGNQRLAEDMYDDGYHDMVNIDISPIVIEQMAKKTKDRPSMTWRAMDALKTDFQDAQFDVVLDKGLLDSLMCVDEIDVNKYLQESSRLLRMGGTFLCISLGAPNQRIQLFQAPSLGFTVHHIELPKHVEFGDVKANYAYVCRKAAISKFSAGIEN